jgi:hypothetical protein
MKAGVTCEKVPSVLKLAQTAFDGYTTYGQKELGYFICFN